MMATFKYTEIPPFTRREGNAIVFNQDGSLEYYIPEDYFGSGASSSATIEGSYVALMGSFNYRLIKPNGDLGKLMTFTFPTVFVCKPNRIEKRKSIKLESHLLESDYRVLIFFKDDQLVTRCFVEQNINNIGELFRLHIQTGRIPNSIPYNDLYEYPFECMSLNSGEYGVHSQAMGLIYSKICRDPSDISKPFRLSKVINDSMTGYTPISIKEASKHISPFVSLTSENLDSAIISAILLSDDEKKGKIKHKESPLERIITM